MERRAIWIWPKAPTTFKRALFDGEAEWIRGDATRLSVNYQVRVAGGKCSVQTDERFPILRSLNLITLRSAFSAYGRSSFEFWYSYAMTFALSKFYIHGLHPSEMVTTYSSASSTFRCKFKNILSCVSSVLDILQGQQKLSHVQYANLPPPPACSRCAKAQSLDHPENIGNRQEPFSFRPSISTPNGECSLSGCCSPKESCHLPIAYPQRSIAVDPVGYLPCLGF